jgi:hypothetical protein
MELKCRIVSFKYYKHGLDCAHCNPVQGRTGNKQGYPCNENRFPAMITEFFVMKTGSLQ